MNIHKNQLIFRMLAKVRNGLLNAVGLSGDLHIGANIQ